LCLFVVGLDVGPAGAEDAFARISGSIQGVIQGITSVCLDVVKNGTC
jgi:hypothetical protein